MQFVITVGMDVWQEFTRKNRHCKKLKGIEI